MQWEPGGRWAVVRASPCAWCMVPATVPLRSLYTCVLEAPTGQEARKWLQLAVFCSPLAPGQTHLQLRVYFLNNTPCALQWAVTNEQPHGGRLRGPCQLFDFTGARGDQCLKLKYISEGEGGRARGGGLGGHQEPIQGRGPGLPCSGDLGTPSFFLGFLVSQPLQRGLLASCSQSPRLCSLPPSAAYSAPSFGRTGDAGGRWEERGCNHGTEREGEASIVLLVGARSARRPSLCCPCSFAGWLQELTLGPRAFVWGGAHVRGCFWEWWKGGWGWRGGQRRGGVGGVCGGRRKTTHEVPAPVLGTPIHLSHPAAFAPPDPSPQGPAQCLPQSGLLNPPRKAPLSEALCSLSPPRLGERG